MASAQTLPEEEVALSGGVQEATPSLVDQWSSISEAPDLIPGVEMVPNGEIEDAGWALARLNNGTPSETRSFAYPETTTRVRLYLIDTSVKHTSTWFAKNAKLSFKGTTRVFSTPKTSGAFTHGSRMLGIIAGPETGAAIGTPIDVVNFDVYPGKDPSATTTSGTVASAVNQARNHYLSTSPKIPSVICIASGSTKPESDAILEYYVKAAVSSGITVVVSAGNLGKNASSYIPAAYGVNPGVITVGATDKNNVPLATSNFGPAVDLYAPGDDVRTLRYANPANGYYDLMDGTSPAAGLTAAAALIELSKNPTLTPAQVEQALVGRAYTTAERAALVQVEPPVEEPDSDGDGVADVLEAFFGSNLADADSKPLVPAISVADGQVTLAFKVAIPLFNSLEPYRLANGSGWKIQISDNLIDWQDAESTITEGIAEEGLLPLRVTVPAVHEKSFLRVEVK